MDEGKQELAQKILISLVEAIQQNNELITEQIKLQQITNENLESLEDGIDALGGLIYKGEQFLTALSEKAVSGEITTPSLSPFLKQVSEILKDINAIVSEEPEGD